MGIKTVLLFVFCIGLNPVFAGNLIKLEVEENDDIYQLHIEMDLDAPADTVRSVLTDYQHWTQLNPSITASEIIRTTQKNRIRLATRYERCVLAFCVDLKKVEDIVEDSDGRIQAFTEPGLSNYQCGRASWTLMDTGHGTRVIHKAIFKPEIWVPPLIGTSIVKDTIGEEALVSLQRLECRARGDCNDYSQYFY